MKQITYLLLALIAGMFSCSKDESLPLTPDLVTEVKAYDLDNNGNSSDIRLSFEVVNNLNVIEYRVMLIPYSAINTFDEAKALDVSPESYFEFAPESFNTAYEIKRLPAGLLDVNGTPIQIEIEYAVAVFVIGTGSQQLSDLTPTFVLKNVGIYSGRYLMVKGRNGCGFGVSDGYNNVDLISFIGTTYSGTMRWYCSECNPPEEQFMGNVSITMEEEVIALYAYNDPDFLKGNLGTGDLHVCARYENGMDGTITDELVFEINMVFEDCESTCEGLRTLIRQGDNTRL